MGFDGEMNEATGCALIVSLTAADTSGRAPGEHRRCNDAGKPCLDPTAFAAHSVACDGWRVA